MTIINDIRKDYILKWVGVPEYYLGCIFYITPTIEDNEADPHDIHKLQNNGEVLNTTEVGHDERANTLWVQWLKEGVKVVFSAETYINNTVTRIKEMMAISDLPSFKSPMSDTTHAELDGILILNEKDHAKFRSLVDCANWLITLGWFDIAYAMNS